MRYWEDGHVSHSPLLSVVETTLSHLDLNGNSGAVSQFDLPNETKTGHAEAWELGRISVTQSHWEEASLSLRGMRAWRT